MSPVDPSPPRSPHRQPIVDEAAAWLAVLSDESHTDEERRAFVKWLRRSNLHVEEFLLVSGLAHGLSRRELWSPESVAELVARARDASGTVARLEAPPPPPPRAPRWRWAAAAGVLLGGLGALAGIQWQRHADTYATSVGEMRALTLEDGSRVRLNTRSRLRVRFGADERVVELLHGEALFDVAHDPTRPFRVAAGATDIVAVGTSFSVYAQSAQTVVTVLEGRVRVHEPTTEAVELSGGEQAVIAPRRPIVRARLADPQKATSWTERRLVFDELPLEAVAAEFARYNARTIRIADPELARLHISGVFDATDPASLVQFLREHGEVRVHESAAGWVIGAPD